MHVGCRFGEMGVHDRAMQLEVQRQTGPEGIQIGLVTMRRDPTSKGEEYVREFVDALNVGSVGRVV